jgi:hypothetical protein
LLCDQVIDNEVHGQTQAAKFNEMEFQAVCLNATNCMPEVFEVGLNTSHM